MTIYAKGGFSMSSNRPGTAASRILEKIKAAEEEIARLIPLRKEEIYNVLNASGGIALDNRLLSGLARYANDPANKDSSFLRELSELGKSATPSFAHRNRATVSNRNTKNSIQQDTDQEAKTHG
jgi:hypothetical protein